jgi:hypothetical protein
MPDVANGDGQQPASPRTLITSIRDLCERALTGGRPTVILKGNAGFGKPANSKPASSGSASKQRP